VAKKKISKTSNMVAQKMYIVEDMRVLYNNTAHPVDMRVRFMKYKNKMQNKKYYTVRTFPKFNRKIVERSKINTPNTHIHDS
jgi:hypothetical protein